jgi:hypothetical protein
MIPHKKWIVAAAVAGMITIAQGRLTPMAEASKNERVSYLPFYVTPFYSGPKAAGAPPEEVAVGGQFDAGLKSTRKADVLAVRDLIVKENALVTPMTLFVLSARLFDVGERWESVFWFYAARDRYRITQAVGDNGFLAQALDACNSFNTLMGPFINGYAFCDIDRQIKTLKASAEWTAKNPYKALLNPKIPSPHANREKAMADVAASRMQEALKSEAYLKDPKHRQEILEGRMKNGADERYCF